MFLFLNKNIVVILKFSPKKEAQIFPYMVANFFSSRYHLRVSGFIEGISYILLLGIAMPLKYWAGFPEAVKVVGMLHGVLYGLC